MRTRRPSASHRAAASCAARSPVPLASWSAQITRCVASAGSTRFLIPLAESAAHAGIEHATPTLSAVSIPSATASHSPARGVPKPHRTAGNRPKDRLRFFNVRFATAVRPQVGAMHRYRAALDVLDKRHHRRQRLNKIACVVFGPWAARVEAKARRPLIERDPAARQILLDDAAGAAFGGVPDFESTRGARCVVSADAVLK